jgi:hypothetical protein
MKAVRSLHVQQINIDMKLMNSSTPIGKYIIALNKILVIPKNYSLLVGRVHEEQQAQLCELPQPKKNTGYEVQYKAHIALTRKYANMMMCLYKTRQSILDNQPTITPCRQLILGGEVLLGITTNKFIKTDGSKVTTIIDPEITEIAPSYKRTKLTAVNSPYLRIQQAYRKKGKKFRKTGTKRITLSHQLKKKMNVNGKPYTVIVKTIS